MQEKNQSLETPVLMVLCHILGQIRDRVWPAYGSHQEGSSNAEGASPGVHCISAGQRSQEGISLGLEVGVLHKFEARPDDL